MVRAAAPRIRGPGECAGAVAIVVELDAGGRGPVTFRVASGKASVVTVKLPATPAAKVVVAALVNDGLMLGREFTVSTKLCVAAVPIPLLALIVMG